MFKVLRIQILRVHNSVNTCTQSRFSEINLVFMIISIQICLEVKLYQLQKDILLFHKLIHTWLQIFVPLFEAIAFVKMYATCSAAKHSFFWLANFTEAICFVQIVVFADTVFAITFLFTYSPRSKAMVSVRRRFSWTSATFSSGTELTNQLFTQKQSKF